MAALTPQLKATALLLRNGNPTAFDDFINLINALTGEALVAMTEAPTDEILVQKGRCQQLRWFLQLLRECHIEKKPSTPAPQ